MGFGKPTPICWQVEIWVLENLYIGKVLKKNTMTAEYIVSS